MNRKSWNAPEYNCYDVKGKLRMNSVVNIWSYPILVNQGLQGTVLSCNGKLKHCAKINKVSYCKTNFICNSGNDDFKSLQIKFLK